MSEPSKKIIPLSKSPKDVLARLEQLEGSLLAEVQNVRSIKAELRQRAEESPTLENLLDTKAVAQILGEKERRVSQLAKKKMIPAMRLGKCWKFSPSALQKWLERQQAS